MNDVQPFFEQILIYLSAAVIAVPISKRCGLGSVLGFLIAGIIIGPWGFALIANVASTLQFSVFGIVMLLFLVGLGLNPERLWSLRRSIFGMGTMQLGITALAITIMICALGFSVLFGLVVGMGFAMSSTSIGLQTLIEKKLLDTRAGQSSFSVLLFQDLSVIPIIILLTLISPTKSINNFSTLFMLGKALITIGALIVIGRYALRPILRFIAKTGLREIFIAFSLLLVLGAASLMAYLGLSIALGAFLAGVLLADSEYRYQLELDIEPFKGLLLGLFFIAVGMSVNLRLFLLHPALIIGVTLGIVALKYILLFYLARFFNETRQSAQIFALALSQIGEFAFVLFNIASSQQLLLPAQAELLNAIVALSMFTTPFLMAYYEKWVVPRQRILEELTPDEITEHNPVIIAGFGRLGGVIARLLTAKGIHVTVIERDPDQVELVRRFGYKAYYGDITRLDLLISAGAKKAKLLILAIDDSNASLETAKLVRQYFPHLKMLARARGRADAFEFLAEKIPVFRETFGTGLIMGEAALIALGYGPLDAKRTVRQFRRHDKAQLRKGARHRYDQNAIISIAQQGRLELEKLLKTENVAEKNLE